MKRSHSSELSSLSTHTGAVDDNGEESPDANTTTKVKSEASFWCDGSREALDAVQEKRQLKSRACRFYYSRGGCKFATECKFAHEP